jgi:hypothetical protein
LGEELVDSRCRRLSANECLNRPIGIEEIWHYGRLAGRDPSWRQR